ncbi:hypothetical protein R3P38DRAFT_3237454 [Favolaschia claudopus]|uniref:Uncharacterized protein n=1 Tax=Favolaschia claudopus TaxID=2862362 RepID=A0AAV9ZBB9_9AGAR
MPWDSYVAWKPADLLSRGYAVHQVGATIEELVQAADAARDVFEREGDSCEYGGSDSEEEFPLDEAEFGAHLQADVPVTPAPIILPTESLPSASNDQSRAQSRAHERKLDYNKNRRRKKRQTNASNPFTRTHKSFPSDLLPSAQVLPVNYDAASLKTTRGGHWLGVRDKAPPKPKRKSDASRWAKSRLLQVEQLVGELDCVRVHWDARRPLLILDRLGRIIVVFVGGPDDPGWAAVAADAAKTLDDTREAGIQTNAFADGDELHRRGRFYTLRSGVSHGGGQPCPKNAAVAPAEEPLLNGLLNNKNIRRICGFQSSAFRTWAPKLFKDYVTDLRSLFDHDPTLRLNFTNSIFPSVTFNLGPQSASFDHLDDKNRALGWCAITNAGNFDATRSALLYLRELKLVVEFPAGATSFIPSAVVHHGNTPLAPHETRYSITQYAAGGLFRYVQYKFRTAKKVVASGGVGSKAALDRAPGERHAAGLSLFSTPSELIADHVQCFS